MLRVYVNTQYDLISVLFNFQLSGHNIDRVKLSDLLLDLMK